MNARSLVETYVTNRDEASVQQIASCKQANILISLIGYGAFLISSINIEHMDIGRFHRDDWVKLTKRTRALLSTVNDR